LARVVIKSSFALTGLPAYRDPSVVNRGELLMDSPDAYRRKAERQSPQAARINSKDARLAVSPEVALQFAVLAQALADTGTLHSSVAEHFDEKTLGKTRTVAYSGQEPKSAWVTVRDMANISAAAGRVVGKTGDASVEEKLSELLASLDKPNAVKLVPKSEHQRHQ
jgi:hypothetical protein